MFQSVLCVGVLPAAWEEMVRFVYNFNSPRVLNMITLENQHQWLFVREVTVCSQLLLRRDWMAF